MPLSDYAHHNEEAAIIWWQEEGRFDGEPQDFDPGDDYDDPMYGEDEDEEE